MAVDAAIILLSLALALSARAVTTDFDTDLVLPFALIAIAAFLAVNYFLRLYHRLWHYASAGEIVVIAAVAASTVLLSLADLLWPDLRPVYFSVV
jgi:FlaA1/EpsC-like NDP-sugar epimerase